MSSSGVPFRVEFPVETFFEKSGEAGKERRIGGVISTEHPDRQGEVVKQRGLALDDFLRHGWFNDNHSKETAGIVGYPTKVTPVDVKGKPATYVEGYLLKGHGPSDKIWDLSQVLQKTDRRLGFSVEGKILRRAGNDGKVIAQANVSNVAITNCPVNTISGMDILSKSMEVVEKCSDEEWMAKMLAAGNSINPPAEATPGDGFALRTESMVTDTKKKKKKKKNKLLTKSAARELIHNKWPNLSEKNQDRALEAIWKTATNIK